MLELVNTSLPNGLIPGTHGFATVAMTKGLPDALRRRLEVLCAYTHKTSAHDASYLAQNPVNWLHAVLPQGEHVLGRVAASDFDYTGRTNRLARLLVFPGREMPAVGGVAILQAESARLSAPWSGEPRHLPADKEAAARLAALKPPAFSSPENWTNLFGPDGAQLAQRFAWQLEKNLKGGGKPIYFKTSAAFDQSGTKLLGLFADIVDLLPAELRASVTFSTYPDALPAGTNCLLRGAFDGDRNFAIASSTQPWVDCEHAKVVHPEMLPSEAEPKPAAAVSGKGGAPTALDAAAPQSLDSPNGTPDRKPLRLKQQPSVTPRRSHGEGSPYLPPPRSDDKKFGIIVAACVVAIVALSARILVWQDGEKKKRKAEEQAEMLRQQEAESAQKAAMLENAITNLALVVNQAIGQLEKMKSKIRTTDNPDHFANEELPMEQGKVWDARRTAKSQGVADDILASYNERFDNAVAEVDAAIKNRKMEQEAARKNDEAQAEAERDKAEAESKTKEVVEETIVQEPTKPADKKPAFCEAERVEIITQGKLSESEFVKKHEKGFQVFYYNKEDLITLETVPVTTYKGAGGWQLRPSLKDIKARNNGCFIIYYSDEDRVAYWLWTLLPNATKGEVFAKFAECDLKTKVFGESTEVYPLFTKFCGTPTYHISRSEAINEKLEVPLAASIETKEDKITCDVFKPSAEDVEKQKQKKRDAIEEIEKQLRTASADTTNYNKKAEEFEKAVEEFKAALDALQEARKKNDKAAKGRAEMRRKECRERVVKSSQALGGISITEQDLLKYDRSDQVDNGIRSKIRSWSNGSLPRKDPLKAEEDLRGHFENAKKALDDFDTNFEKQWHEVAEQSRYAVTAVKGSKEKGR